ncbi:GDNF family receptor alpha-2 isoform X2 [Ascaphus truei]|uniref:GDNF family receptor alpha-2 isoform X2 n=1 Tax=Ascaphus truei TaxID=8439 RepID=UPI003F5A81FB
MNMLISDFSCSLIFLAQTVLSLSGSAPLSWPPHTDCVRANELCAADSSCSSRYRTLRQCLAGRDRNALLSSRECQTALEVLQDSALYLCRCHRGMKRELQCLHVYWSIHAGLAEGDEFYEASPYEPVTSRMSDIFRLASITSGADPPPSKQNACLDAAKSCNLNDSCKRLRSGYISTCNMMEGAGSCSRRKCHKALRIFMERVSSDLSYPLLFCPCRDVACGERRRQTAVPDCSFQRPETPNCMELWGSCRQDPVCRSRLADFITSCQASTLESVSGCVRDNYPVCLRAYAGLLGFDVALNFLDSDPHSLSVGPWCSCKGSGDLETECETYLREFTHNRCLKNAINAFGNGADRVHTQNVPPRTTNPSYRAEKRPQLPDNLSDSNTLHEGSPIATCATLQTQLNTDLTPNLRTYGESSGIPSLRACTPYFIIMITLLFLTTPF